MDGLAAQSLLKYFMYEKLFIPVQNIGSKLPVIWICIRHRLSSNRRFVYSVGTVPLIAFVHTNNSSRLLLNCLSSGGNVPERKFSSTEKIVGSTPAKIVGSTW